MTTTAKIITCTVILLFFTIPLALMSNSERVYDLEELIELGLQNSHERQSEALRLKNSKSSLTSSYVDFLPSANVNVGHEYTGDSRTSAGLSISKNLYLNDSRYFNWRRSRIDWGNAELSYQENKKSTVFEVFLRVIRTVEAQKRVEIQKRNLAIQERVKEQTELLHRLDQRSLIELKQSEIALINAQVSLEDSQQHLKESREDLFMYLNIDDEGHPIAEIEIPVSEELPNYREPVDLTLVKNNLKKADLTLTQSKLSFLPNISLNYSYIIRTDDDVLSFDDYSDSYTVSLSASYSLFNYVQNRQTHHRNRREKMIQEINIDRIESGYQKQYQQMIRNLKREDRLYELSERRQELAEETLELARSRFDQGVLSLIELEQATKDYHEATIELSTRYYQRLLKQEELNLFLSYPILGRW